jgi:hypothetical protein
MMDLSTTDEKPASTTHTNAATPYAMCLTKGGAAAPPPAGGQGRAQNVQNPNQPAIPPQTAPLAVPAAAPQQTALVVNLPPGVIPGHFLRAMGPDGVVFTFKAPMGSTPGCPVRVVLPTQTAVLSVRIPDGAQPGQEITALSPTGVVLRLPTNSPATKACSTTRSCGAHPTPLSPRFATPSSVTAHAATRAAPRRPVHARRGPRPRRFRRPRRARAPDSERVGPVRVE